MARKPAEAGNPVDLAALPQVPVIACDHLRYFGGKLCVLLFGREVSP